MRMLPGVDNRERECLTVYRARQMIVQSSMAPDEKC